MIQSVEEAANVQIQPPVHLPARDPSPDRIQRIMLAAAGAEAIAEAQEVLLINLAQDPRHRLLDDLVLQRCDAQRSLHTLRLGYPIFWGHHTDIFLDDVPGRSLVSGYGQIGTCCGTGIPASSDAAREPPAEDVLR